MFSSILAASFRHCFFAVIWIEIELHSALCAHFFMHIRQDKTCESHICCWPVASRLTPDVSSGYWVMQHKRYFYIWCFTVRKGLLVCFATTFRLSGNSSPKPGHNRKKLLQSSCKASQAIPPNHFVSGIFRTLASSHQMTLRIPTLI